jgi:hypothetical protein
MEYVLYVFGKEESCNKAQKNPFLRQDIHIKYIYNFFERDNWIIPLNIIAVSSSFLVIFFMNYNTLVVNHQQCLYNMPLLLTRIEHLSSILIYGSGNLVFGTIDKSKKARKILFNVLWWCFESLCFVIYFLRDWYVCSYHIQYSIF